MNRILVTGGSGGIGKAVVSRLAAQGHAVWFTFCRNQEQAEALATEAGAQAIHYDQASRESIHALAGQIRDDEFDALVNNSAPPPRRELLQKANADDFMAYQTAAVRGVLELCRAFAARVRQRQTTGAIVNVLTSYTLGMPPAKLAAYVTSKYALLGLTRSMAVEFIRHGVRVNAVSPGVTRTDFIADLPELFVQQVEAGLPMQRLADPREVAAAIQFLISSEASYINGANVPITGGYAC